MDLKNPQTIALLEEHLKEDPEVEERRISLKSKISTLDEVLGAMRGI